MSSFQITSLTTPEYIDAIAAAMIANKLKEIPSQIKCKMTDAARKMVLRKVKYFTKHPDEMPKPQKEEKN